MMELLLGLALVAALAAGLWWRGRRRTSRPSTAESDGTRQELARRLSELFALQELTYVLADSVDLERIAEQVVRYATRFVRGEGVLVALREEPALTLWIVQASGSLAPLTSTRLDDASGTLVGAALTSRTLQSTGGSERLPILGTITSRTGVAVPLQSHGTVLGAIAVVRQSGEPFTEAELRLLSTVATHTAVAFSNARFVRLIRRAKEQWEATFDALADGLAVLDEHDRVLRANQTLARLVNREVRDVIEQPLPDLLGLASQTLSGVLRDARTGAAPVPTVLDLEAMGRLFRVTVSPLIGGDRGSVVVLLEDVTERKALEQTVLQNEKMAAVGQLVSGVAHELNNPLTSIVGLSEFMVQQGSVEPRAREHLQVVHEQAVRAAGIVRHLLTFARKEPAERRPTDLNDVVERTAALMGYEVRLRGVSLELNLAPGLPPVDGDPQQLQQVILNLLNNAVQAVSHNPPERPRVVTVSTGSSGNGISLRVADTGPGVPAALAPRVFDPFFTTKPQGEGTGLGLSITYGIVQGHGGTIRLERPPRGGAVFAVWLPRSEGAGAPQDAAPAADSSRPSGSRARGVRALLLDDDAGVRRMVELILLNHGHRVETARDAAHAMELLDGGAFGLILADPSALDGSGARFADVLCERHPDLRRRTVFLTADVRSETEDWLRRTGCRVCRKPFHAGELLEAVEEVLR
jgi:two-component system NtrC family sensor kinase